MFDNWLTHASYNITFYILWLWCCSLLQGHFTYLRTHWISSVFGYFSQFNW